MGRGIGFGAGVLNFGWMKRGIDFLGWGFDMWRGRGRGCGSISGRGGGWVRAEWWVTVVGVGMGGLVVNGDNEDGCGGAAVGGAGAGDGRAAGGGWEGCGGGSGGREGGGGMTFFYF